MKTAILSALMALLTVVTLSAQSVVTLNPSPPTRGQSCTFSINWDDYPNPPYSSHITVDVKVHRTGPNDVYEIKFSRPAPGDPQTTSESIDLADNAAQVDWDDSWGGSDSSNVLIGAPMELPTATPRLKWSGGLLVTDPTCIGCSGAAQINADYASGTTSVAPVVWYSTNGGAEVLIDISWVEPKSWGGVCTYSTDLEDCFSTLCGTKFTMLVEASFRGLAFGAPPVIIGPDGSPMDPSGPIRNLPGGLQEVSYTWDVELVAECGATSEWDAGANPPTVTGWGVPWAPASNSLVLTAVCEPCVPYYF